MVLGNTTYARKCPSMQSRIFILSTFRVGYSNDLTSAILVCYPRKLINVSNICYTFNVNFSTLHHSSSTSRRVVGLSYRRFSWLELVLTLGPLITTANLPPVAENTNYFASIDVVQSHQIPSRPTVIIDTTLSRSQTTTSRRHFEQFRVRRARFICCFGCCQRIKNSYGEFER